MVLSEAGNLTVFKLTAVTWPWELVDTESTAVNVLLWLFGVSLEVVSVLVISLWLRVIVSLKLWSVVKLPPLVLIAVPPLIVIVALFGTALAGNVNGFVITSVTWPWAFTSTPVTAENVPLAARVCPALVVSVCDTLEWAICNLWLSPELTVTKFVPIAVPPSIANTSFRVIVAVLLLSSRTVKLVWSALSGAIDIL